MKIFIKFLFIVSTFPLLSMEKSSTQEETFPESTNARVNREETSKVPSLVELCVVPFCMLNADKLRMVLKIINNSIRMLQLLPQPVFEKNLPTLIQMIVEKEFASKAAAIIKERAGAENFLRRKSALVALTADEADELLECMLEFSFFVPSRPHSGEFLSKECLLFGNDTIMHQAILKAYRAHSLNDHPRELGFFGPVQDLQGAVSQFKQERSRGTFVNQADGTLQIFFNELLGFYEGQLARRGTRSCAAVHGLYAAFINRRALCINDAVPLEFVELVNLNEASPGGLLCPFKVLFVLDKNVSHVNDIVFSSDGKLLYLRTGAHMYEHDLTVHRTVEPQVLYEKLRSVRGAIFRYCVSQAYQ